MYTINEFEVQIDGSDAVELHVAAPPEDGSKRASQALVLIERFAPHGEVQAGEHGSIDIVLGGNNAENISQIPDVAVYAAEINAESNSLRVRLTGRAGERFRVFVGWARRRIEEERVQLSCTLCRKVIKTAIRAALAAVGVPTPGELTQELTAQLMAGLALEGIAAFLREIFGDQIISILGNWIDALIGIGRAIDAFCRAVCEMLGICDPEMVQNLPGWGERGNFAGQGFGRTNV